MKTFCLVPNISGTIFSPYSTKPLVKNDSKPWPKDVKRASIDGVKPKYLWPTKINYF